MGLFLNLGAIIATIAIALGVLSGTGYKLGWWELGMAFTVLRWSCYAGLASAASAVIGLIFSKQKGVSILILLAGLGVSGMIFNQVQTARSVPPIHDITTDTENPPVFVDVVELRGEKSNSVDYATKVGPKNPETDTSRPYAVIQAEHYPHIGPLNLEMNVEACFDLANEAAIGQKWEIVSAVKDEGRIEATDVTFWFGFKDDVVIRVTGDDASCRVDMRSSSRVGMSDVGVNAKRIEAYLSKLEAMAS